MLAFKATSIASALPLGARTAENCFDILAKCSGKKFISVTYSVPQRPPKSFVLLPVEASNMSSMTNSRVHSKTRGIRTNLIYSSTLLYSKAIYVGFPPSGLS